MDRDTAEALRQLADDIDEGVISVHSRGYERFTHTKPHEILGTVEELTGDVEVRVTISDGTADCNYVDRLFIDNKATKKEEGLTINKNLKDEAWDILNELLEETDLSTGVVGIKDSRDYLTQEGKFEVALSHDSEMNVDSDFLLAELHDLRSCIGDDLYTVTFVEDNKKKSTGDYYFRKIIIRYSLVNLVDEEV